MKMKTIGEEGQEKEGLVKEILNKGDLTAEELKEELRKKDVSFVKSYDRLFTRLFIVLAILWLLPAVARYSGWQFLSFFAQLPRVEFPIVVIVVGVVFFIAAIALEAKVVSMRQRRGGCQDTHESVVIVREGPYKIVMHPGYLAEIVYFSLLPVILSKWLPFTILAVVYIVGWIGMLAYLIRVEDNFNIRKWGDEYRQFMRDVPMINFVKGLWNNLGKRRAGN
uniref:Steroid 5-alpha reductase C-terminal domain-containing protein n=1 Tax=Candidatus Methanophagaceae archaeon ANME-1 ERB6 TaxID=2759912 RepID=A0A7G9YWM3_9EURY|nr:hypothetical protein IAKEDICC_00028 [Methanosarcinales archaeon ANME-1 ERB6]